MYFFFIQKKKTGNNLFFFSMQIANKTFKLNAISTLFDCYLCYFLSFFFFGRKKNLLDFNGVSDSAFLLFLLFISQCNGSYYKSLLVKKFKDLEVIDFKTTDYKITN